MKYQHDLPINFGKNGRKLITVAIQDIKTKKLLFNASTNKSAFMKTLESSEVWLYSRSRKKLWHKGSTSGCFLQIRSIRINCENNSLLYLVECLGQGACHIKDKNGQFYSTCFFRQILWKGGTIWIENI